MDLYDEFGNYIGGGDAGGDVLNDDDDDVRSLGDLHQMDTDPHPAAPTQAQKPSIFSAETALVLHEDKKYYQDADELYPTAKAVTFNTDAQNLDEPIIRPAPKVAQTSSSSAAKRRVVEESLAFQLDLMAAPAHARHVAVVGNIHHGKTALIGSLLDAKNGERVPADKVEEEASHSMFPRKDEQDRLISIKGNLSSVVLQTSQQKSYLINLLDSPGHSNFHDEAVAALSVSDGCLLVVDAVEGVLMSGDALIREAVRAGNRCAALPCPHVSASRQSQDLAATRIIAYMTLLRDLTPSPLPLSPPHSICLCVNKVDRLILELKLPPQDAYFKVNAPRVDHPLSLFLSSSSILAPMPPSPLATYLLCPYPNPNPNPNPHAP